MIFFHKYLNANFLVLLSAGARMICKRAQIHGGQFFVLYIAFQLCMLYLYLFICLTFPVSECASDFMEM